MDGISQQMQDNIQAMQAMQQQQMRDNMGMQMAQSQLSHQQTTQNTLIQSIQRRDEIESNMAKSSADSLKTITQNLK